MPTITPAATATSSLISLIKTIIGAGLLSISLAFSTDGIIFGIGLIIIAALTSGYGLFLQAYCSKYVPVGHATFFNLSQISYPKLSLIFDIAIAIQCFGCAMSYLVLIGDLMPTIVKLNIENLRTFWILISGIFIIPLSFLHNLDSLKSSSLLGILSILYISVIVICHYFWGDIPIKGEVSLLPPNFLQIPSTFSIIVFAYTGHQNMFSIINEAKDKSLSSLSKLINLAILVSTLLFISVGLTGYLTFGDLVQGNIILLYPASWSTTFARFCIVTMVTFSFPLMFHPARISVNNIYFWLTNYDKTPEQTPLINSSEDLPLLDEPNKSQNFVPFSDKTFKVITTLLLLLAYILAITIKSFSLVLAVVGATGSTAISFILPGLFGWKLIGSESNDLTTLEKILKVLSLVLVIWGFLVMILCLSVIRP